MYYRTKGVSWFTTPLWHMWRPPVSHRSVEFLHLDVSHNILLYRFIVSVSIIVNCFIWPNMCLDTLNCVIWLNMYLDTLNCVLWPNMCHALDTHDCVVFRQWDSITCTVFWIIIKKNLSSQVFYILNLSKFVCITYALTVRTSNAANVSKRSEIHYIFTLSSHA